jgi:formate/nitrite transporter FocA (FNT family)
LRRDFPQEEAQKNYHTILEQQTARAEEELRRPALALFLSGLTAGLDVGFGPFAMAVNTTLFKGTLPDPVITLLNAIRGARLFGAFHRANGFGGLSQRSWALH